MPFNSSQKNASSDYRLWGFPEYGSDDVDIIEAATFLTDTDIGSAIITGTANINSDGLQVSVTQGDLGRIRWISTHALKMAQGGHVSFDMTTELLEDLTIEAGLAVIFDITGTNARFFRKNINSTWQEAGSGTSTEVARIKNEGMPYKVRVHLSWDHSGLDFYVDYMLIRHFPWNAGIMPDFDSNIAIGCYGTTFQITKSRFSNIQWSKRPISLPPNPRALNISFVGDSFVNFGQYTLSDNEYVGEQVDVYGDATVLAVNTNRNRGMIPVCHSELAKKGIYIGERIHNYGRGGSFIWAGSSSALSERTDALSDDTAGEFPFPSQRGNCQIIVSVVGTNDVTSGRTDVETLADYKTEIDRWDALGIDWIILCNIAQRYDNPNTGVKTFVSEIISKNAVIESLVSYNSKVRIVNIYSGTSSDSSLIGSDGLHPSITGQSFIGKEIAKIIAIQVL